MTCSIELHRDGKPSPRTCSDCGLGPCRKNLAYDAYGKVVVKDEPRNRPRAYDLENEDEINRLLSELEGYMRVSLREGTDTEGRHFALAALVEINKQNPLREKIAK